MGSIVKIEVVRNEGWEDGDVFIEVEGYCYNNCVNYFYVYVFWFGY